MGVDDLRPASDDYLQRRLVSKRVNSSKAHKDGLPDGKIHLQSSVWPERQTVLADQVAELRWRRGQVHVLRRNRIAEEEDKKPGGR